MAQPLARLRTSFVLFGALCVPVIAVAASPEGLSGQILGQVRNASGIAQMGANVYLYNRYEEVVRRGLTTEQGRFAFDALTPDVYSIRVVLASFVPAERRNIAVLPNSENRLDINLSSVLSSVDLAPPSSIRGTLMTDDWKWVLRSSQSTRSIMRFAPELGYPSGTSSSDRTLTAFSNTTGLVKLSAGDGQSFTRGAQQDLGTAFALATSIAGNSRVQFSGNVGYAGASALPAAGFRTSYSRTGDNSSPEVILTMHQLYLMPRGAGIAMGADNAPPLRTMSLAFVDKTEIADNIRLDYGFDLQSVSYLDRMNYASPFIRATYDAGSQGRVRVGYSSGAPPAELLVRDSETANGLDQSLSSLAMMPRITLSNSRVAVERTQNYEIGYERVEGSRTYSIGAYRELVSNAGFLLSGPTASLPAADLLPDISSRGSIFNVGSYQRVGYSASVAQTLGDRLEVAVAAGRTGALANDNLGASYADAGELRAGIRPVQRTWVTMRASSVVPKAGTKVTATYGWTDFNTLMPTHVFLTQKTNQDVGMNVFLRQPLPAFLPWRMELTAELRNLLAQGYLPIGGIGTRSILTNSPRTVRGGLAFIF
ncbi:MAG: carboxypeptidase-like regulatory domain-containing protein [Bryobacteraceae bacterium]